MGDPTITDEPVGDLEGHRRRRITGLLAAEDIERDSRDERTVVLTVRQVVCDRCGVQLGPCATAPRRDGPGQVIVWERSKVDLAHDCPGQVTR